MRVFLLALIVLFVSCSKKESGGKAESTEHKAKADAKRVFFKNIKSGDVLKSPFKVEMGVAGMEVEPAGPLSENKGHHHIIINKGHITEGTVIPNDAEHIHFGAGQKETELTLKPGKYTLTLQFADGVHRSYGEKMANSIEIEVSE